MTMRESLVGYIWDAYKDVHGIRPRFIRFDQMSDEDLERMADDLQEEIRFQIAVREQHEQYIMFCLAHPEGYVSYDEDVAEWEGCNDASDMLARGLVDYMNGRILPSYQPPTMKELFAS